MGISAQDRRDKQLFIAVTRGSRLAALFKVIGNGDKSFLSCLLSSLGQQKRLGNARGLVIYPTS
jgi:hypothetical protein